MSAKASSSRSRKGSRDKRIPVFVFPEDLKFVEGDPSSHKQVLTLYNPYDFNIKFEIFSNAPSNYAVVESKGFIKADCCVDIVIRHLKAGQGVGPYGARDKFRIDIYYEKKVIGRKLVPATLVDSAKAKEDELTEKLERESFKTLPSLRPLTQAPHTTAAASETTPMLWLVLMALLCLLVLLLPLEGESPTWPSYLHISVNQKLIASFALGLVTMAILKS